MALALATAVFVCDSSICACCVVCDIIVIYVPAVTQTLVMAIFVCSVSVCDLLCLIVMLVRNVIYV